MQAGLLLLGGLLPLFAGPLLAGWADRSEVVKAAMDAFTTVTLMGIVILHIWPHAFLAAGSWALAGGLLGLCLPFLLHGPLHAHEERMYPGFLVLAFFGLAVHAVLDGVALFGPLMAEAHSAVEPLQIAPGSLASAHHAEALHQASGARGHQDNAALLSLAVILHRLPMGLAVWWFAVPIFGRRVAMGILGSIAAATLLGFSFAGRVLVDLSTPGISVFEAIVAGMLLHVVLGHEHGHAHHPHGQVSCRASALGTLAGLALLIGLGKMHPIEQRLAQELPFGTAFLALAKEIAPPLALGILLSTFFGTLFRGAGTFRLPGLSTRSRVATRIGQVLAAAGPELGLPTLLVSWTLLGFEMTLVRFVGVAVGLLCWVMIGPKSRPPEIGFSPGGEEISLGVRLWRDLVASMARYLPWTLMSLGFVSLLEPMIRLDGIIDWPIPFAALAAAMLGGFAYLHPMAGTLFAFLLLHMDWPERWVLLFLVVGAGALVARRLVPSTASSSVSRVSRLLPWLLLGSILPLFLWSGPIGSGAHLSFHQMALAETNLVAWISLLGLGILAAIQLFRRGLRGFLHPIFDPSRGLTLAGDEGSPDVHGHSHT